ncbi:histidine kinase [Stutzerimonas kirkiae]|uniref:histidine kinase n=1 Tax=Stutzerimonas kirkiae TaxID=2211392 RepID=A0A4Q9QZ77_9GAMM|nr:ATP-binding protein [Stutzerimonas kirkiae]TBU89517.1 histidine kinase [Stutzerimonas kirkiae]TBU98704.1 histidine kinase [Stutzerimonas kirkiae]
MAQACQPRIEQVMLAREVDGQAVPPVDGWQPVSLPDIWPRRWHGQAAAAWYRVEWRNECPGQVLALNIERMVMAGQVFLNGHLIWQDERMLEPLSRSWNLPRYWLLPDALLAEHNTLLLRLYSSEHPGPGLGMLHLGTPERILPLYHAQFWRQRHVFTINLVVSLVLSGMFLALWLMRRVEQAFGWFALASLLWSIGIGNVLATSTWPFSSSDGWDRLSLVALVLYCCAFCMFIWAFGQIRFPRLARVLWLSSALVCVAVLLLPTAYIMQAQMGVALIYRALFVAICLQFLVHAMRTRQTDHLLLGLCLLSFLFIGGYHLLGILQLIELRQDYQTTSSVIIALCMFLILAWRYTGSMRRIEAFNDELKVAVDATREELTQTLSREHRLEMDNVRLSERLGMTHDLHDSLGSSLMRSIAWVEQARGMAQEQFLAMLKELRGDLRHVIDGASGSGALVSETPGEWLAPLRHRFGRLFDELGLASHWRVPPQWPCRLSAMQQLALTRFVEEALTNVIKHSRANSLEVVLEALPEGGMSLCVTDDGVGFDVQGTLQSGMGIGMQSMRARIERIGGQLSIESEQGRTSLRMTLRQA